jgi:hypothetical protein
MAREMLQKKMVQEMDDNFRLHGWRYSDFCTLCILDVTCKPRFAYPKWMLHIGLSLISRCGRSMVRSLRCPRSRCRSSLSLTVGFAKGFDSDRGRRRTMNRKRIK